MTIAAYSPGISQPEMDQKYKDLMTVQKKFRQHQARCQDTQMSHYVGSRELHFLLTGPTINDAWFFFQQTASQIRKLTDQFPSLMYTNKKAHMDPTVWGPTSSPAKNPL